MLHEPRLLTQFLTAGMSGQSAAQALSADAWEPFTLGLGLVDARLQLWRWNSALPRLLNLPSLLPNTDLSQSLGLGAIETRALLTVLQQNKSWTSKLMIGQRALRVELNHSGLHGPDGGTLYALSVLDYSDESREVQALTDAKNQAERTDRAKSQFLSHMSHELRTPLNAIIGFSQLLAMDDTLTGEQMDSVKEIEKAGDYLLSLINEILDLARIEAGRIELHPEDVLLEPLLRECHHLVKPLADAKQITLQFDYDPTLDVQADHVRLKQIVINLLSNAIKYNDVGGKVLLQCRQNANVFRLEVVDSGYGIARGALPCIFSPFERLGADQLRIEGTGIGLMLSRRLLKLMKGDIGVISDEGAGSLFWVELPRQLHFQTPPRAEPVVPVMALGLGNGSSLRRLQELLTLRPQVQFCHDHDLATCKAWLAANPNGSVIIAQALTPQIERDADLVARLKLCPFVVVVPDNLNRYVDLPLVDFRCLTANNVSA